MTETALAARRTGLYRLFDHGGVLLYIGIGYVPERRWKHHRRYKSWWPDVDPSRTTVVWYDDREAAESNELAAIRDERPIHNLVTSDDQGCIWLKPSPEGKKRGRPPNLGPPKVFLNVRIDPAVRREAIEHVSREGTTLTAVVTAELIKYIEETRHMLKTGQQT
jgi:hypothetical protein